MLIHAKSSNLNGKSTSVLSERFLSPSEFIAAEAHCSWPQTKPNEKDCLHSKFNSTHFIIRWSMKSLLSVLLSPLPQLQFINFHGAVFLHELSGCNSLLQRASHNVGSRHFRSKTFTSGRRPRANKRPPAPNREFVKREMSRQRSLLLVQFAHKSLLFQFIFLFIVEKYFYLCL